MDMIGQHQQYVHIHNQQLQILLKQGYFDQLVFQHNQHHDFGNVGLIHYGFYAEIVQKYVNKPNKTAKETAWLAMSLACQHQQYHHILQSINNQQKIQQVQQWINNQIPKTLTNKSNYIDTLQKLMTKTTNDNYLNITQVPVYLLSTQWLRKLYSVQQKTVPAVDNRHLVVGAKYIDTNPEFLHLNYEVGRQCKENIHFKIVGFEAWKFIADNFGGFEVQRFTTPQKCTIVQIWYPKVQLVFVQQQYIHNNQIEMLVSRFETITSMLQRLKAIVKVYKYLDEECMGYNWQLIRSSNVTMQQLIDMIQQGEIQQDDGLEIVNPDSDVEGASIIAQHNILIVHMKQGTQTGIFHKLKTSKPNYTQPRCLKCGVRTNIQLCTCKTVYFCSQHCQKAHLQHAKECSSIIYQQKHLLQLLDYYQTTKRSYKFQEVIKYGLIGLENLGNTCYLNSALQCILKIQVLSQYFISNQHVKDLNVSNVLGTGGHLACAYAELVKDYYTTHKKYLTPIRVLRIVAKNQQFRGNSHQDSQQFLNYFLDKLHEDINKVKQKPYLSEIQSDGRPDQIVSQESWTNFQRRNQSFISEQLAGQYRSEIRCPDCQRISITFDPFMSVTLPFPPQQKKDHIKGYYLSPQGEFLMVQATVKPSMLALQFYMKTFGMRMHGVHISQMRVCSEWDAQKSIFKNNKKGILLFYQHPADCTVQLNVEIVDKQQKVVSLNRRMYLHTISSQQQLLNELKKSLKYPISRALKIKHDQYSSSVGAQELITIVQPKHIQYPISNQTKLTIKIHINEVLMRQKIKWDYSSREFNKLSNFNNDKSILTLAQLLTEFQQPQILTEDNAWYCNQCKQHKLAHKIMSIYRLPFYLIVHLKRFNHKGKYVIYGEKVKTPIQLKAYQFINGYKFELIGVVNHFGSLSFGHYTSFTKKNSQWYYFDDESVKRAQVDGDNAYLMFFKRCN